MGGAHSDVSKHVKAYIGVFIALAVFTVLTVAAAQIQVSQPMHIAIAMAIAVVKASLVAAIFMHLKWERAGNIWFVLALCAVFFVVLMLLPALTTHDLPPTARMGTWD